MKKQTILVVDDDREIVRAISKLLELEGYETLKAYDGLEALDVLMDHTVHLILMDVMMPRLDGLSAVLRIRERRNLPVILLSAKSEESDKVLGLSMGADDYMTKPFDIGELLARVRALTRRQGEVIGEQLAAGDLVLDTPTRSLRCGEKSVRLGFKEFDVLRLLLAAPRAVIPKEDIISKVWGLESEAEDNNVEVYISFLRKKLAYLGSRVSIGTVRKVGYHLEVPAV